MESYEFIESGLIFNLLDDQTQRKFKYTPNDFAKHGDAFRFITNYFDKYREYPEIEILCENYPTLDIAGKTLKFDYAFDTFKKQVLFRSIVGTLNANRDTLTDNPKMALSRIMTGLTDLDVVWDSDIIQYNKDAMFRFDKWKMKNHRREMGEQIIGIRTPFPSINKTGVGWMKGELASIFARPTVGKSWLCVEVACQAVLDGHKTLLISTEMPEEAMSLRADVVLSNNMGYSFSHRALRTGLPIDEAKYKEFLQKLGGRPFLICDHIDGQIGISLESIAGLVRKYNPELVVIDGVYLVTGAAKGKAIWEQNHSLFYGLKGLATTTNTPFVVSTQATRDASDLYSPPRADQVAFGDAMIRASDIALALFKVESNEQQRMIQFQKYREGELPSDVLTLTWDVDKGNIEEYEDIF